MLKAMAIGLDFGTTNSSIALAAPNGVQVAAFAYSAGITESFRSLLYLHRLRENGRNIIKSWSGPAGIDEYLHSDEKGRLIQSLKSFLSSRSLQTTEVFGRRFWLEELIARILADIRIGAEAQFGSVAQHVVVGRPVRFVGAESAADDDYALARLKEALLIAGFKDVSFEYEPVAAAYHYESTLERSNGPLQRVLFVFAGKHDINGRTRDCECHYHGHPQLHVVLLFAKARF